MRDDQSKMEEKKDRIKRENECTWERKKHNGIDEDRARGKNKMEEKNRRQEKTDEALQDNKGECCL